MTVSTVYRRVPRKKVQRSPLRSAVATGVVLGIVGVYLAAVGILAMMHGRPIIVDVLSLGQAALLAIGLSVGTLVARRESGQPLRHTLPLSILAGAIAGGVLGLLVIAMIVLDLRSIFIALSPALLEMLTFELDPIAGIAVLVGGGAMLGGIGALVAASPTAIRKPLVVGFAAVAFFGVFQELIQIMMQFGDAIGAVRETIYTWDGLTLGGAGLIFVVAVVACVIWMRFRRRDRGVESIRSPAERRTAQIAKIVVAALLVVLFPVVAGSYIGQVLMMVGLYILMGMGLNLEVGLAGLLDLGFVAFFAVGAYTTALLTADSSHALAAYTSLPSLSYWAAMPIAVLVSVIVGILFGVPVLGVRGDYLAVATLGLGEIVRVIVQSDAAAPLLAGAEGILQIPKPSWPTLLGGPELSDPVQLFFLTLACAAVAAYCAWRLENSRLGRAWMAVRDDEDVAQALGINLIKVKLLAYGLGAAFAGLSGSIFAVMLTSVYPSSFQLLVSINVLALIIVGGMGSLPGVIVGAVALVGLPELLREFGENRYLVYGVALIVMMRIRPEGLWPSVTRRRELRAAAGETEIEPSSIVGAAAPDAQRPGE